MKMETIEQYQCVKWCPGAESNHRHEDFQSTALPLSYPGTGCVSTLGVGVLGSLERGVQTPFRFLVQFFGTVAKCSLGRIHCNFDIIGIGGWNGVAAAQPFCQIDICAAL